MYYRKHQALFSQIRDERKRLDRMCELNVQMQFRRIAQTPIIEAAWMRGQPVHIHGWIYGVEDGLLREVEPPISSLEERDRLSNIDQCASALSEPASAMRRHAAEAFAAIPIDGAGNDPLCDGCCG